MACDLCGIKLAIHNRISNIAWWQIANQWVICYVAVMDAAATRRRVVDYFDGVAESWIGYAFPPAWRAIEHSKWKPDESAAYCLRCGDSVGAGEATESGCGTCREGAELEGGIANGVIRLGIFTDDLRDWVHAIKFGRWVEMGEELGRRLGEAVAVANVVDARRAIVVPMPMPWQRRLFRGVDHSCVVARAAARQLHSPLVKALARDNYMPQVSLPPSIRKRSGSHGLRVRNRWLWDNWIHMMNESWRRSGRDKTPLRDVQVVLVDDVRTTGATLKAAARLLRTLKPDNIVCAVLAVSDSQARRERKEQAQRTESEISIKPEPDATTAIRDETQQPSPVNVARVQSPA
jgi:predicted amidophosphoribosyltransferase